MSDDLKIVMVPKELYYHEVAYVRGLEQRIEALEAALRKIAMLFDSEARARLAILIASSSGLSQQLQAALQKIAKREYREPWDVIDIARAALAPEPDK